MATFGSHCGWTLQQCQVELARYDAAMVLNTPHFTELTSEPLASESQEDRELAEALRVQAMSSAQRSAWLNDVWGRVQRNAAALKTSRTYAISCRTRAAW
jgi:hypothetical protein